VPKTYEHWETYFDVDGRKTSIVVHVLAHSWYRARAAAQVVLGRIGEERKGTPHAGLIRTGYSLGMHLPRAGDYVVVADEEGGMRVFKAKGNVSLDMALMVVAGEIKLEKCSTLEEV
jgi:hypothetical protein